ncbi:MAG TPA: HAD family phosphatase, partial [Actinopolymorphaceae bacterium]
IDATVDGNDLARLGLADRPDPAIFLEACRRLGVEPARAALIEDSVAGVEAAFLGGFALVIGVDRYGTRAPRLRGAGAHLVVGDLAELDARGRRVTTGSPP